MCPKGTLSRARSTVPKKCVCCTKGKGSPVGDHCFALLIGLQTVALALSAAVALAAAAVALAVPRHYPRPHTLAQSQPAAALAQPAAALAQPAAALTQLTTTLAAAALAATCI